MTLHLWSVLLQWSRVGTNAAIFLLAARFLTLPELGAFAIAFAPVRLAQSLFRAGIVEMVVIGPRDDRRLEGLFWLSLGSGIALSLALVAVAYRVGRPDLAMLGLIPALQGASAVSEGLLRRALQMRGLALRSVLAQGVAAAMCLLLLFEGYGSRALCLYMLVQVAMTGGLSLWLAAWWPRRFVQLRELTGLLPATAQITARDLIGAGVLPLAQLLIGASFGLAAAGAFQLATRLLSMLEALTLAPLRILALPLMVRDRRDLCSRLTAQFRVVGVIAGWVWFGAGAAATEITTLGVGEEHARITAPVLVAVLPIGFCAAVAMPFAQALTARGVLALNLYRAMLLAGLSLALLLVAMSLGLPLSLTALSLSAASLFALIWFIPGACAAIGVSLTVLLPLATPIAAGTAMVLVLNCFALGLLGQILLGTLIYGIVIAALLPRPQRRPA